MKSAKKNKIDKSSAHNANWQGVDKEPGAEKGKAEKVTMQSLKDKKVDANPTGKNK